jgi:iron complex transport system substrate-binding protein
LGQAREGRSGAVTSREPEDLPVELLFRCFGREHPGGTVGFRLHGPTSLGTAEHTAFARPGRKDNPVTPRPSTGARPPVPPFLKLLVLAALLASSALVGGCGSQSAPAPGESAIPRRIISHTLASDEILLDLVPTDRIVGVTTLVDDPEISNVAGKYPANIPRLNEASAERIIGLAPDLVCVAPHNSIDFVNLLKSSGLPVYYNEAVNTIDEVEAGIAKLGERVGEPEKGHQLAARVRQRRNQVAEKVRDVRERPRVLFWSAGFTAGAPSTIDDLIREAGGRNVAAELGLGASAEIAPEQMVAADPDYLLLCR